MDLKLFCVTGVSLCRRFLSWLGQWVVPLAEMREWVYRRIWWRFVGGAVYGGNWVSVYKRPPARKRPHSPLTHNAKHWVLCGMADDWKVDTWWL